MTSARKSKSNRANARSSTGPKTARGRARSARNALRFGLSLVAAALRIIHRCCRCEDIPAEDVRLMESKLEGPDKFITILSEIARRLPALDRYERRALSRRKFAIRALDAARTRLVEAARPTLTE